MILMRSQVLKLLKWKDLSPYSGEIERGTAEYRVYNELIEVKEKIIKECSNWIEKCYTVL
ncbi:hypothetical protein Holit_00946 [Hollandina sp. SP2]